jgi:glycosyltransferase involved in cell wall biosynthesis
MIDPEKTYIKQAEALNLQHSVHFYEPVKNIEEKYASASIYAMPSRSEGFGMVLIEAMANGLPCVSFDCPSGPKDIISHNIDGILVQNGDLEAFGKALKQLMLNPLLRKKMGNSARLKAQTYRAQNIVPQWHSLFNTLIQAKQ